MDADVEAMLDAPYQEKKEEQPMPSLQEYKDHRDYKEHRESRSHRDYRDYRDDEHRSRHAEHRHSSRSHSRHRSSRHRSDSSRRYRRSSRSLSRERRHRRSPSREYKRRSSSRRHSRSPTRRRRSRTPPPSIHHDPHDRYRDSKRRGRGRSPSPPIPEEDRDRRTVFVTQLAARLTRRELDDFFSQAGRVREATIITDRNSRKSKGCGYVEFYEEVSVQNALALSGQKLLGIPVIVQLSEAEKNRLAMQAQRNAMGLMQEPSYQRLYVGSLHFSLTEDDVRQIFEPFGPLDFVNLHKDTETGRSKGFGFIQYKNATDAKTALEKMNGFELAGRSLKVGLVTEKNPMTSNLSFNLDDEETEGVAMNSLSRVELMAKLAARESNNNDYEPSPVVTPVAPPKPNIPTVATRYIMLNNMFNPAEETDPDWVSDLEADIKIECERYGVVEHIKVNADSMGEVFLKFDGIQSAEKAIGALNGRWFGGKQITASYVPEAIFNANAL
ncbi:RNA-binding protein rsd1 [Choanephora cucurbitarum]|uniref:RNA-binding protein rsd1 n=1 Tax=Choanephora cucurbitarum TaxID=101091 RepID=A0A1C7NAH9_9FUNG|nr:RNA-binding protein rsd1 [Choanephora cucurbitarum]